MTVCPLTCSLAPSTGPIVAARTIDSAIVAIACAHDGVVQRSCSIVPWLSNENRLAGSIPSMAPVPSSVGSVFMVPSRASTMRPSLSSPTTCTLVPSFHTSSMSRP